MHRAPDPSAGNSPNSSATAAPPARRSRLRRWWRGLRRLVLYACFVLVVMYAVLILTPLTERLYLWLTVTGPPEQADVIVCLGGQPERMFWAAELYHQGYAPRVVVTSWEDRADEMRDRVHLCGVPREDLLVDRRSVTTGDHPGGVAALPGIDKASMRFLIVTNHEHSRRVRAVFRHAGYRDVIIYGGDPPFSRELDTSQRWRWRVLRLPYIAYEYAAMVQYKLQGRI